MDESPKFEIVPLTDVPDAMPELIGLFEQVWAPWYGPNGNGDARADLVACLDDMPLPYCLVARGERGQVLGAAALRQESIGDELGVGPWLAGLLVIPDARGKGLAAALIAAIERDAGNMGFEAIYISSRCLGGALVRRGWTKFGETGRAHDRPGAIAVYRRRLKL
jgi:GNAT superfamily N-acetyltransferase